MKNKLKSGRTFGIWSGHIPEKYQYNPRLPKGNTFITFKLPIIDEDLNIGLDNNEQVECVSLLVKRN